MGEKDSATHGEIPFHHLTEAIVESEWIVRDSTSAVEG
jgi:hypothetical protein